LNLSKINPTILFLFAKLQICSAFIQPTITSRQPRLVALYLSDNVVTDGAVTTSTTPFKGCSIEPVPGSLTTFTIRVDGQEADLGAFSAAIYKKIIQDAKQERFQGFRPGTIPPHLEPTYRAFSMDECAREATLEAMEQNNIRPFENARSDFEIEQISITPPPVKKAKKKSGRKALSKAVVDEADNTVAQVPAWLTFENMKGAIDAGWKPGQNFSFVVKNVRGQQLKDGRGATSIGNVPGGINLNQMAAEAARREAQ